MTLSNSTWSPPYKISIWLLLFSCKVVSYFLATPQTAAHQPPLSSTISQSLLKLMLIESVMASNHSILFHPLSLLLSIFPNIRVFSNESALHIRWPKYWGFSFRIDLFDLLAVEGTLKSLLQHHISKASILRCSAFFTVQLSHPYIFMANRQGKHGNSDRLYFLGLQNH